VKATRAEARAAGEMHYFTGKPCKHGHFSKRLTSNGQCTACALRDAEEFRTRNPAVAKARVNEWREKNRATYLAAMAEYREQNREYFRERSRQHQRANPEMHKAKVQRRRAARINATPAWHGELTAFVTLEAADLCARRERVTGAPWHIDHMVPLRAKFACGLHVASNIQVIPQAMNLAKRNKMILTGPGEWLKQA
jgi:hypothetical protein